MTSPYNPFTVARANRVARKKARKLSRRKRNRDLRGPIYRQPVEPRPRRDSNPNPMPLELRSRRLRYRR